MNEMKGDEFSGGESSEESNSSSEKIDKELEYVGESDLEYEPKIGVELKSVLKCPKCEEEYGDKQSFLEHLQLHSGKMKSCVDCHKVFQNSISFKFHKRIEMCSRNMFKCKLCSKTFDKRSQYSAHLSAHKRNQCSICGDHFSKRKNLEAHVVTAHNSSLTKDSFRCHLCERTFSQRRSLVYHYKIGHPDNNFICPVCLDTFESSTQLEDHMTIHKQQTFTCDKCDKQFSRRQQYLIHMKDHERYKCVTCSESFSAKKTADTHARLGHQVKGLEFQLQCAQCGQLFYSMKLLNAHMVVHTDGVTCEKCNITFKHERNYKSHLQTQEHIQGEELKNIVACKECNKTFTNKNNLRVHVTRVHKANTKEHACTHCLYKTKLLTNFKRHIALHTEKPQFICDKCGAQFQTKSALQEHNLLVHLERREHSCDKCGKTFGRSSELNRHFNIHSDEALFKCDCGNSYKTLSNLKRHQFLTHNIVEHKKQRLKKFFISEKTDPPKKKVKKPRSKKKAIPTNGNSLDLSKPEISSITSTMEMDPNTVMITERQDELMGVPFNMDFSNIDKSHVVYTPNLDMSGLQVVESMIQLESDPTKQGTVLINVRNLFGRTLSADYVMPPQIEPSIVSNLVESIPDTNQQIVITNQKHDIISALQEYVIPNDLNFLSV